MAEYAGYVASPPVNYGEITNGLVSNYIAIDQAKRAEDKKTQEEFDKYFDDNLNTIKDFEYSKSQTTNDMLITLAQGAKKAMYDAKKTGSKQEINRTASNLKTSINNINNAIKASNENFGIIQKATLEGKVSSMGNIYADYFADAMNSKKSSLMVMPDGTIPYVQYDENGKIASTNSFFDPAALSNPAPFIDPSVDYDKDLKTWADSLGTYQDKNGLVTRISPMLNPAFGKAKETKIAELTSTPRNTARFLSSVGGYQGYKDEASKQKLINEGVPKDKLIQVSLVNGIPQPILTDAQNKEAKKIAEQQINQRVGFKRDVDNAPRDPYAYLTAKEAFDQRKAAAKEAKQMAPKIKAAQIADAIFNATRTSGKPGEMGPIPEFSPLKQAAQMRGLGKISVSNVGGEVIITGVPKGAKSGAEPRELARLSSPGEVYAYLTGKENIIDAKADYDLTKDYILSNEPAESEKPQENVVTLSQIKSLTTQQRGGLNEQEYAAFLNSQGYTVK